MGEGCPAGERRITKKRQLHDAWPRLQPSERTLVNGKRSPGGERFPNRCNARKPAFDAEITNAAKAGLGRQRRAQKVEGGQLETRDHHEASSEDGLKHGTGFPGRRALPLPERGQRRLARGGQRRLRRWRAVIPGSRESARDAKARSTHKRLAKGVQVGLGRTRRAVDCGDEVAERCDRLLKLGPCRRCPVTDLGRHHIRLIRPVPG